MTQLDFLRQVMAALRQTERDGLLSDRRGDGLSGLSGDKTVGTLQRLAGLFAADAEACYLEVGVYQGLTLVSVALEAPGMACFGIDNFATMDPGGENLGIVKERLARFGAANATLIDDDFEAALGGMEARLAGRKVGLYFIDGPHDYRSQMVCLLLAKSHLHEQAVIVIDDANYAFVRQSTADFLAGHGDFKMVFEAYTPTHPANMDPRERDRWQAGWLNGVNVLVRDPGGLLPHMAPSTDPDRTLYFNEWLVHRSRMAELAPDAVGLADAVCSGDGDGEAEARRVLADKHAGLKEKIRGRYPDRNTYSDGLTEARFTELPE